MGIEALVLGVVSALRPATAQAAVFALLIVDQLLLDFGDFCNATGRPLMVSLLSGRASLAVKVTLLPLFTFVSLATGELQSLTGFELAARIRE